MQRGNSEGQNWRPVVKYRDFLPQAVQKWLNRSIEVWDTQSGGSRGTTGRGTFGGICPIENHCKV